MKRLQMPRDLIAKIAADLLGSWHGSALSEIGVGSEQREHD
jgi:hypothetical protein